jgi:SET domain-containing protein
VYSVKTYVDRSSIHGVGVFTSQDILKGDLVWESGCEVEWTQEQFERLSPKMQEIILTRGWKDTITSTYHLSIDNDQFTNHSDNANITHYADGKGYANRDIKAGEELTDN